MQGLFDYSAQQQVLLYLQELLASERLEAHYTNTRTASTQLIPSSLVRDKLVAFDITNNRVRLLNEIEGLLSISADKLIKLLRSKSVIASLHTPTKIPHLAAHAPAPKNSTKYLTPKEAAKMLGYSVRTLDAWRMDKNHKLEPVKMGNGRIRYALDELERFMSEQRKP